MIGRHNGKQFVDEESIPKDWNWFPSGCHAIRWRYSEAHEGVLLTLFTEDDGTYYEQTTFHSFWLPSLIEAMQKAEKSIVENSK